MLVEVSGKASKVTLESRRVSLIHGVNRTKDVHPEVCVLARSLFERGAISP